MDTQNATVYVVDDDSSTRRSMAALAASCGIGCRTFASAEDFLAHCRTCDCRDRSPAGCLVIDVRLQDMDGIELQEELLSKGCLMPVIMVSGYADVPTAVRAMRNGALTVLEKPLESMELLSSIRRAIDADRASAHLLARQSETLRRLDSLDARELHVLELIIAGVPNKCISSQMAISQRTVDRLRAAVFEKMGVDSAVELTRLISEVRTNGRALDGPHHILPPMSKRCSAVRHASEC